MERYPDEFDCDMAQYYHIYDYKSLPARKVATFLCGLDSSSRVKRKLNGVGGSFSEILLALIFDRLQWICWSQTKDGQRGVNRPQSIAEKLIGKNDSDSEITAFRSGKDYEEARRKILGKEG